VAISFRFARADEYSRLAQFLDEFWAKDHAYCRMQDLFEWTFKRPGHWEDGQCSFAVAEDGDTLAGILGGIPFTFNSFGKTSRGVWIVNYVIRPDHRKGTLALQLLGMFRRPEFNPVIAFGITQATTVIYRVLRGEVLPEIPRHFLVLPEARDRMTNLLQVAHPDWTPDHAASLASNFAQPLSGVEASVQAYRELPSQWNEVDWPAIAETTIGVVRDADFMNWRYRNHPRFQYQFLSVPDGKRSGLAVWRLETIRRQTDHGREDIDRIGRLVEFLPTSQENARSLFSAFVADLRGSGALGADYYGFHGQTRLWLRDLGFTLTSAHPEGGQVPTRFQPLDGKGGGILSAMFFKDDAPRCWEADNCPWYWTKSDSDQDRPN